jgi:hypothetical protein
MVGVKLFEILMFSRVVDCEFLVLLKLFGILMFPRVVNSLHVSFTYVCVASTRYM